ncbi:MAG TPA: hypothetical protein VMD98_09195 [Bryocella sp.]|nr:hypothetical protein [Bryocella sp.]
MRRSLAAVLFFVTTSGLMLLAGCGGSSQPQPVPPSPPSPLSAGDLNLIFVPSEDVAHHAYGDVNLKTGNLTNRGLQRSLKIATFLQQKVLGGGNVSGIYALTPMTHLQTANQDPDMAALMTMEQFAMLNLTSMSIPGASAVIANSYPVSMSYSSAPLPENVHAPLMNCPEIGSSGAYSCQGLDYRDLDGDNEALIGALIQANTSGFYVFAAPWETISSLMGNINHLQGYGLALPTNYVSPNYIYAIATTKSGSASLITYNSSVDPSSSYPTLPAGGIVASGCLPVTTNTTFHVTIAGGADNAVVPAGINTNETIYFVRHAEAHPTRWWEDGNYYGKGQWRALDLPNALRDKIYPNVVYSIDPAQVLPGADSVNGEFYSYVRTNTTVLPYAIAYNLPYNLATSFELLAQNGPLAVDASSFFFFGGQFSNQRVLVGWEHDHIAPTVNALLAAYHSTQPLLAPWPSDDYDTVWTVKLDSQGNVSVDNLTCEGISSSALPATPPQF